MDKFRAAPDTYLNPAPATVLTGTPPGTTYTCPMHPQVRQPGPGNCPICGMALKRELPSLDEPENPELADFRRRFWWTLPLTIAVTLIVMLAHQWTHDGLPYQSWVEFALSAPVILWAGKPFFERGLKLIANMSPNMWTLIGPGTAAAFLYSVAATLAPGAFPAALREDGKVAVYYEAAAVIVSLTLLGQILELRARSQTSAAIKALLNLAPKMARRIAPDGGEEDVPLTHVHVSDMLRVRPGEKVPVDGTVLEGCARRGDADRRATACDETPRRQAHRRDHQHQRQLSNARRKSGGADGAVANRPTGRQRAALTCTDAAAGRRGG